MFIQQWLHLMANAQVALYKPELGLNLSGITALNLPNGDGVTSDAITLNMTNGAQSQSLPAGRFIYNLTSTGNGLANYT